MNFFKMQYKLFLLLAPPNKNAHPKVVTRVQENQQKKSTCWNTLIIIDFIEVRFYYKIFLRNLFIYIFNFENVTFR